MASVLSKQQNREILKRVSAELGLEPSYVRKVYRAYWRFVVHIIRTRTFYEDMTEEEYVKMKPNIVLTHLGKLYCSYGRYRHLREKILKLKARKEANEAVEGKTHVQHGDNDDEQV